MEQDLLKMLAQFRILLKKERGAQVDFEKLVLDPGYARETLALAEDADSEVLVTLALGLRQKLGLLKVIASQPAPQPASGQTGIASPKLGTKYLYGARG